MSRAEKIGSLRRFGPFSLNSVAGELRRDNARVRLQPQPLRLLILLTERPGELITREEIRRAIWGDEVHLEFEPALNFAIGQIRSALRESASSPLYIETVPKIGYRFIAELQQPEAVETTAGTPQGAGVSASPQEPYASKPLSLAARKENGAGVVETYGPAAIPSEKGAASRIRSHASRSLLLAGAVVAGALLVLGGFRWTHLAGMRQTPPTSIVVLPLVNMTGDPAKEYLADGLTEEMIARLAMSSQGHLRVIARTSSMFYKAKPVTAKQVGAELGTFYVLESSIRSEGTGLQVTLQLVRSADESHVWTKVLSTAPDQVFLAAGSAVPEVLKALQLPEPDSHAKAIYVSASVPARDEYIRGRQFLWLRTRDSLYKALDSFQSAVSADPAYAEAYAGLATTYNLLGQYGWMAQKEAADLGEKAANKSLSLNDTSADAYAARGFSRWFYQWDWVAGEQDLQEALRRDPSNANALHWYALALATAGRSSEARTWMDRALVVDPKSQILQTNRGWIEYLAGRPEEAARRMEAVLHDDPGFLSAHNKLWSVYSLERQDAKAFDELRYILPYSVAPDGEQAINLAYRIGGYHAAMQTWLRTSSEVGSGNAVDHARVAVFAKERERAISILMNGHLAHDGWIVFMLTDPAFDDLRADPRIRDIARDLESKQHRPSSSSK